VSSGSPLWLVWALCGRAPEVVGTNKKVPRHPFKHISNILHNVTAQMSLKWCQ
jgi:hypothetical protein